MFSSAITNIGYSTENAPDFHYYLKRHIELDGDEHGPMSELLIQELCQDSEDNWPVVKESAMLSIKQRIRFWDMVESEIFAD